MIVKLGDIQRAGDVLVAPIAGHPHVVLSLRRVVNRDRRVGATVRVVVTVPAPVGVVDHEPRVSVADVVEAEHAAVARYVQDEIGLAGGVSDATRAEIHRANVQAAARGHRDLVRVGGEAGGEPHAPIIGVATAYLQGLRGSGLQAEKRYSPCHGQCEKGSHGSSWLGIQMRLRSEGPPGGEHESRESGPLGKRAQRCVVGSKAGGVWPKLTRY